MKYHDLQRVTSKSATVIVPQERPVNVLLEDVCLPALVIKKQALENNIAWMQRYADTRGVSLAPHGKTTMTAKIFQRQMAGGAWAIGVGSAWQARVAITADVGRVMMVNQLVGRANMQLIALLKSDYPVAEFICCVDSISNARTLSAFFSAQGQTLDVLLEMGIEGGRCGCRSVTEAEELAEVMAGLPGLRLRGIELYEGVIHAEDPQPQIEQLLRQVAGLARTLAARQQVIGEFILTGAGTSWYDVVCDIWLQEVLPDGCRIVIRPGCYITHDRGIYQQAQQALMARDDVACGLGGDLQSALELVAMVQSVPENGLAVVNFGKRDCAFDAGLPQPIALYRHGQKQPLELENVSTVGIMDQHAILNGPAAAQLQVGDIMLFGTSHPCLTFDKWQSIYLVDEKYNLLDTLETAF